MEKAVEELEKRCEDRGRTTIVKKLNILIMAMTDVEESKVHIQYPYVPRPWTREQDPCWPQAVAFDHTIESEVPNWLTGKQDLLEFISKLTVAAQ